MASEERGSTQIFPLGANTTALDDDKGTSLAAAFLSSPPAAVRDDVAIGTAQGTPERCPTPIRVIYYNVTYDMPERALCGCFARGG